MAKKILLSIAGIALVVLLALASVKYYFSYQTAQYHEEVVPFLEEVIPAISTWDVAVMKKYMADEALANFSDDQLAALARGFSRLGELKSFSTPKLDRVSIDHSGYSVPGRKDTRTVLTYISQAVYENGEAGLTFKLIAEDDEPKLKERKLYHFNVRSQALME